MPLRTADSPTTSWPWPVTSWTPSSAPTSGCTACRKAAAITSGAGLAAALRCGARLLGAQCPEQMVPLLDDDAAQRRGRFAVGIQPGIGADDDGVPGRRLSR